jgi:hypothetical protein
MAAPEALPTQPALRAEISPAAFASARLAALQDIRRGSVPALSGAQGIFNGALLGALAWLMIGGSVLLIQSLLAG